jgi:eukaryotic-like serine/threonine-protein kinase
MHLRDLSTSPRPCLVLERLGRGSIARLLESRDSLAPGEAVTVLAPVAAAVSAMHADGVAHRAIRSGAVLFRESGAPVLCGFGHATLIPPRASIAALANEPAVLEDYRALDKLVRDVLLRVHGEVTSVLGWLDQFAEATYADSFADALAEHLFELGKAEPVRSTVPARVSPPTAVPLRSNSAAWTGPGPVTPTMARSAAPHRVTPPNIVDELPIPVVIRNLVNRLTAIRKPAWLVAVVGAAVLTITMLVVLPVSGESPSGALTGSAGDPGSGASSAASIPPAETGALTGDDPVAALAVLLETRARCIRDLSVLCLDSVLQDGSAAMDDDRAVIRSIQNGAEAPTQFRFATQPQVPADVSVVEREGNAVLLSVGGQAGSAALSSEILVMKGESGWRIRAYLDT